jgi:RNA-directed DNA polymerase
LARFSRRLVVPPRLARGEAADSSGTFDGPLSPLLGAFFLSELDQRLEETSLFYVRYMDDVLVLAPTRWKLRHAIRVLNQTFAALGLEKHPDKTFIGRTDRGFDFLGYRFERSGGLALAPQTLGRHHRKLHRLQERERAGRISPDALGVYRRRFNNWARGGLPPDVRPSNSRTGVSKSPDRLSSLCVTSVYSSTLGAQCDQA